MTDGSPHPGLRRLNRSPGLWARVVWGTALLVRPGALLAVVGAPDPPAARRVARTLGARHLVEAALEATHGCRWRRAGGVVDALHATTGVGLATVDRRWRRAALVDAAIAGCFAVDAFVRP